jgi:glycosyltransferase involved in cell wall biosynthesis
MRVAIDALPLLIRSAGVKNYLYYWIAYLQKLAGTDAIRTVPEMERGALRHEASIAGRWRTAQALGWRALANYTPLPVLEGQTRGAGIFHATNLARRPPRGPKLTATVYDMTCWLMPELHTRSNLKADAAFEALLRRADGLIAISRSTRNDAVRALGLKPEKIAVIYPGIAAAFFEATPPAVEAVRARYGLRRPFILSVGTIEPRKNIDGLVRAYGALAASTREEFELVLAGPMGWASGETAALVGSVRYLGYVPEEDLAPLTAAATVFAYPSFYEGFGLPVAQAMAAGVPVVTSNVSSLPEVVGEAALLVDPRSLAELRDGLEKLLGSEGLRREMAARGRARAEGFRWEECARRSWEFWRGV